MPRHKIALGEFCDVLFKAEDSCKVEEFTETLMLALPYLLEQNIEDKKVGLILERQDLERFLSEKGTGELVALKESIIENARHWLYKEAVMRMSTLS
mmetsp:Transcript_3235/g.4689  ORF Transcript_3235/g.4689 Transcript_3235/m.4689 type:complete len:97 (+) Transcript_3235:607-897(+)